MPHLRISLLGPFRATLDGEPVAHFRGDTVQALLAYLAMHAGTAFRRQSLAALLWPDDLDSVALVNLRQALRRLRTAIGDEAAAPPFLDVTREILAFNPESDCRVDAAAFAKAVAAVKGHAHPRLEACSACAEWLREAVELYRGEFLAGFSLPSAPFEEWMVVEREHLHGQALEALAALAAYCEEHGEYEEALGYARRQVELEPWRESAHRQWMRALALSGQRGAALAQYEACRRVLAEELGVEPEAETVALYERIRDGQDLSGFPKPDRSAGNLPAQLLPFVGRETELAEIEGRLDDPGCRLLTLVGPGGSGKTRLALEAAGRQLDRYPDGVYFVSLAPLQSIEAIVPTIAQAIGFSFYGSAEPKAQLLGYLRRKNVLLVLDNYEHLLEGAGLAADILGTAPEVRILVTSRAGLHVGGEQRFPVAGMDYPALTPPTLTPDPSPMIGREDGGEGALRYSAVQLFTAGARRAQPDFELTDDNLADVVRICRLVEGMPLAILLAASWMEMLTPSEIAAEIQRSLDFLAFDQRDAPERQRSMRAVFDHSWRLLSEREQEVFAGLSVFRGGCTREAAQEVTGASLRDLMSLVDRSLLQRTAAPSAPDADVWALRTGGRFEMHELLRQYAAGKLAEHAAEEQAVCDRHAAYYAQLIRSQAEGGRAPEIDNAQAGWQWAVHRVQVTWMRAFVYGLAQTYEMLWQIPEGIAFSREAIRTLRAVEPGEDRDVALATALAGHAHLLYLIGEAKQMPGFLGESQALLRQHDAAEELAQWNIWAARTEVYPDDATRELAEEALVIGTRIGRPSLIWSALAIQGWGAVEDGNYDEAERRFERALQVSRAAGLLDGMDWSLTFLGNVAYMRSDYVKARQYYQECLTLAEERKTRYSVIGTHVDLGDVAQALGEHERAREHYEDALVRSEEVTQYRESVRALHGLGNVALAIGDQASAGDHYRRALRLAADKTDEGSCAGAMTGPSALLARRGKVELAAEVLALVLKTYLYPGQARSTVYRLLAALQSELSPAVFAAAQERGRARDLEATVEELLAELDRP